MYKGSTNWFGSQVIISLLTPSQSQGVLSRPFATLDGGRLEVFDWFLSVCVSVGFIQDRILLCILRHYFGTIVECLHH